MTDPTPEEAPGWHEFLQGPGKNFNEDIINVLRATLTTGVPGRWFGAPVKTWVVLAGLAVEIASEAK